MTWRRWFIVVLGHRLGEREVHLQAENAAEAEALGAFLCRPYESVKGVRA